jgi:hypothetical protein
MPKRVRAAWGAGRRWVAGAAAVAGMATCPGVAVADTIAISTTEFHLEFHPLTLTGIEGGSTFSIECHVTLDGRFEASTFSIRSGPIEVGTVERASIGPCDSGGVNVSFLTETLPWDIVWSDYTGTLPVIDSLEFEIRGLRLLFQVAPVFECLYRSTQATPATVTWAFSGGTLTERAMNEASPMALLANLSDEDFFRCPGALELSGTVFDGKLLTLI